MTFLGDRDGDRTDGQTDIWTDRLFSENIILELVLMLKITNNSIDTKNLNL